MAHFLNFVSRFSGCYPPPRFPPRAPRPRNGAVKRNRRFQSNQRYACSDPSGKSFIQLLSFALTQSNFNFHSSRPKQLESAARNFRIGIAHGCDDSSNARLNQSLRTGRSSSMMRAWLKINVERRPARIPSSGFQRDYFGVFDFLISVKTFADYASVLNEHRA